MNKTKPINSLILLSYFIIIKNRILSINQFYIKIEDQFSKKLINGYEMAICVGYSLTLLLNMVQLQIQVKTINIGALA